MRENEINGRPAVLGSAISMLGCMAVGLIYVAMTGVSPVGKTIPDLLWTAALGAFVALVVSRAPLWIILAGCFVLCGSITNGVGLITLLLAILGSAFAVERSNWSASLMDQMHRSAGFGVFLLFSVSASLFAASLALHDHGRPHTSAIVALLLWLVIGLSAFIRLPRRTRAILGGVAGVLTLCGTAVLAVAAIEVRGAYDAVTIAESELRQTMESVRVGDLTAADESAERAASELTQANDRFNSIAVSAVSQAPIAGQNLRAVHDVLGPARSVLNSARSTLKSGRDIDGIFSGDGIEVDAVRSIAIETEQLLADALVLHHAVEQERGPWIMALLAHQLHTVAERTAPVEELADLEILEGFTGLLGTSEQRSYLLLFGNTAEARELGGFSGGAAMVTLDDGQVSLEQTDRPDALNSNPADPTVFSSAPPQRFLQHSPWLFSQNFTAMSDFPTLARALGDLYPAMGGSEVDGVAYIDPEALAALIGLVGEVELQDSNIVATAETVVPFVTIEQYAREDLFADSDGRQNRERFLHELVRSVFNSLLELDTAIDPALLSPIAQAVREDRLLFVPFDDDEFETMKALGLTGGVTLRPGADYLAVSHLNGGPNKLDAYLHRSIDYRVEVDPLTGKLDAVVDITLRNDAPAGLAAYAASNRYGYPLGTNRAFVVVHTPHNAVAWSGDEDEPSLTRSWTEFGLHRYETVVAIPRGETRTVSLQLTGEIDAGDYHLDIGHQPLLHDDALALEVTTLQGSLTSTDQRLTTDLETMRGDFWLTMDTQIDAEWNSVDDRQLARAVSGPLNR